MSLEDLIKREGATLVDVREPYELQDGRVEGALNIPLNTILQQADRVGAFSKPVVLFCRSGNRSGMASMMLQAQGVKEVYNGGSWQDVKAALSEKQVG